MSRGVLPVPLPEQASYGPGFPRRPSLAAHPSRAGRIARDRCASPSNAPTVDFAALAVADTQVLLRPFGPGGPVGGLPEPTTAIFVDRSGRRRRLLLWCGAFLAVACLGFATLLGLSMVAGNQTAPGMSIPIDGPSGTPGQRVASHPAQPSPGRTRAQPPTDPTPTRSSKHAPAPTHTGSKNA